MRQGKRLLMCGVIACLAITAFADDDTPPPAASASADQPAAIMQVAPAPRTSSEIQYQLIECRALLAENTAVTITKVYDICFERIQASIRGVLAESFQLSASEKRTQIYLAESILESVRRIVAQLQSEAGVANNLVYPVQSSLATIENLLLRYLSIVQAKETWDASIGFGLGIASYYDSFQEPQLFTRGTFRFDLGRVFDGSFNFGTASSHYEYSSFISLPVREANWFTITEAMLRWKQYQRFIFKLGRFPDTHSLSTPSQWPFTSVMGDLVISQVPWFGLTFSIRHDKYGTFIPERNVPTASIVERTLTQLQQASRFSLGSIARMNIETIARFHWYADANQQLSSLSLGRARQLGDKATTKQIDYRIFQTSLKIGANFNEKYGLNVTAEGDMLKNISLRQSNNSFLMNVSASVTWQQVISARLETYRAILQCAAVPPLALEPYLIPGFALNGIALQGSYRMAPSLELTSMFRLQGMVRRLTGDDCSQLPTIDGDLQHLFFGFITSYYFSN